MYVTRSQLQLIVCTVFVASVVSMDSSCPNRCYCPSGQIFCNDKDLLVFPEDLQVDVVFLSISNNEITTIPSLSQYSLLTTLNASRNRITKLDEDVFLGLRALNVVDLSYNEIASLSDINAYSLFGTNDNLQTLILSNNKISIFDENYNVIVSTSLKVLDLSSNHIKTLENRVLAELPSLTHLHMSRNPLQWMKNLQSNSLNYLDVSFGKMDLLNRDQLRDLPRLQELKVSGNQGFTVYRDLVSNSLLNFEARSCQLTKPSILEFVNLKNATLRGNKIELLKANGFIKNSKLKYLDLSSNAIRQIEPDSFLGLSKIQFLYLAENQISELTWDMFITNFELEHLSLSKNPIKSLPVNLTLSKLTNLDLSHCKIHLFDSLSFSFVPVLQVLDLSHNVIEDIQHGIHSNSMKVLNLSNNRLVAITNDTFSKLPNIEILNIVGNRFTITPKQYMFSSNTHLKILQLSDNPWICECKDQEFKELWEYLKYYPNSPSKLTPSEIKELTCTSPENVKGKGWEEACFREFNPLINQSTFFDRYGVYILITVMTISFTLVVIVSIRERMKKREKVLRGRLEARRRTVAENHERVVRLYRESVERVNEEHRRQEDASLQERVERHPPTYEEAVLMPRREDSASRDELRSTGHSAHDLVPPRPRDAAENTAPEMEITPLVNGEVEPHLNRVAYDDVSIYSEVAGDESEDEEADEDSPRYPITISVRPASDGGSVGDRLDEAKLMHQLRIEVWSREDIRNEPNSNNDSST